MQLRPMRLLLILPLLSGCAAFQGEREAQQNLELANNRAEVKHSLREICTQIRAATLKEMFPEHRLIEWHSFCDYD